jgi:hypothetical protein
MQYSHKPPALMICLFINGLMVLALLAMPELALAGRIETIAREIAAGADKKVQQLIVIGITAAIFLPLLVMLYLATEKKGFVRFAGIVGAVLLSGLLYMFHFT